MGQLQTADILSKNVMSELDKILRSGSAISITGLGEPVLVTWFNVNDKLSTVTAGIETADAIIGEDSPFRYNKVENQPAFGVTKDLQNIEMALDDNGILEMNIEIEPVIPPNTIIPSAYDHMVYKYASGRSVTFRVNNVQLATLRQGNFYKVPMHLIDIDSDEYETKLKHQTVKELIVDLDRVGTNEQCVLNNKVFDEIKAITNLTKQMISDYVDTFFSKKYNSFLFRGFHNGQLTVYDPYLMKFILNHKLLDFYDEIIQPYAMETDENFRVEYNKTVFRAVEMRDVKRINELLYEVLPFPSQRTNPFGYRGEESVFYVKPYIDGQSRYPRNLYMDFNWLYNIPTVNESNSVTILENLIIRYFKTSSFDKFMLSEELEDLKKISEPDYTETYYYLVPIVLYIITAYKKHLNDDNS